MKNCLLLFVILIVNFGHKVLSATWYECTCVPYYQCNIDYLMKDDATDIHEKQRYSDERPRPSCNEPVDVCCDFQNQTLNGNNEGISPNGKYEWSCGHRGNGSDVAIGETATAELREFPWVAAIFRNGYGYYAGGSLINEKVILTAAHKVHKLRPSDLIVHVGPCNLRADKEKFYEGTVVSIHVHPNFEERSHVNDYALIILAEPVKPNAYVNSICLAESNDIYDVSECIETGWGKNREVVNIKGTHLQKSHLFIIDRTDCQNNYRAVFRNNNYRIHRSVLCAGDNDFKAPCPGDAGNPLICPLRNNPKRYVQVGISSIAVCNERNRPGLYADVAHGYQWIYQVVESQGFSTKPFRVHHL